MKLWVGEYASIHAEPCERIQVLEPTTEGVVSDAFGKSTRFVRIYADGPCALKFGKDIKPSLASTPVVLGRPEWLAVQPGHRVAAVAISKGEEMEAFEILRVLASPEFKAHLDQLQAATEAAKTAEAKAAETIQKAAADLVALRTEREDLDAKIAALEAARAQAAKEAAIAEAKAQDLAKREKAHQDAVLAWQGERATEEASFKAKAEDWRKQSDQQVIELNKREASYSQREEDLKLREESLIIAEKDYEDRIAQLESLGRRKRA